MINVLITSAGTASAINVIKSLRIQNEFDVCLFAVDADYTAPGLYLADYHAIMPRSNSENYFQTILDYCLSNKITIVFPIHSSEIEIFAARKNELSNQGIKYLLPDVEIIRLCNSKKNMCDTVTKLGISAPKTYEINERNYHFPLIAKPDNKSGSKDLFLIHDKIDLEYAQKKFPQHILQEWIEGIEVTVDCFFDYESELIVASPRQRLLTKAGQCVKGLAIRNSQLELSCARIGKSIGYIGPCNIQFIFKKDEPYFIEINPRFAAGGLMLTVKAGANIPEMAIELIMNHRIFKKPAIAENIMMLRYYEELFIDTAGNSL